MVARDRLDCSGLQAMGGCFHTRNVESSPSSFLWLEPLERGIHISPRYKLGGLSCSQWGTPIFSCAAPWMGMLQVAEGGWAALPKHTGDGSSTTDPTPGVQGPIDPTSRSFLVGPVHAHVSFRLQMPRFCCCCLLSHSILLNCSALKSSLPSFQEVLGEWR